MSVEPETKEQKPPTLPAVLWQLAGLIFQREALLVFTTILFLLIAGGAAVAWAQSQFDAGVGKRVQPLEKRQSDIEEKMKAQETQMANVERMTVETNANVRLIAERLNLRPITLEQKDGGQ